MGRIWVRFGLWIAATVLMTVALLAASMLLFGQMQYRNFARSLPPGVRQELDELVAHDLEESPRALAIYSLYWRGDLLFGEKLSLLAGLAVCLPFGLFAGFWVSRTVTLPLGSMAAAAKRIGQGDLTVRAAVPSDLGEMAEMVRRFNDMADALERFERERKVTTAAISHELRTPLTILRARLHAACDGVIVPTDAEFRHLLDQAEHLGRLVDDLHTLSMAEAGRLPLQREPLDLVELARDALDRHGMRLTQRGIEADFDAGVATAIVHGDKDRLRQVLANLIENASRHAQSGGWLQIGVHQAAAGVAEGAVPRAVLTVSDAGPGLSEAVREHMFRRFSDPHGQSSRATHGGSGLGLSIVHMLVTQHGGEVSVDASARGGTRFTISLPLSESDARAKRSQPGSRPFEDHSLPAG